MIEHIETETDRTYRRAEENLLQIADIKELREVVMQEGSEYEGGFLGFLENYEAALKYIPSQEFIVVDIGCYLAAQSYFFKECAGYVGVDVSRTMDGRQMKRCCPDNAMFFDMYGQQFLAEKLHMFDVDKCFAIMSAVPDFELADKVRSAFPHHYIAYPGEKTVVSL